MTTPPLSAAVLNSNFKADITKRLTFKLIVAEHLY